MGSVKYVLLVAVAAALGSLGFIQQTTITVCPNGCDFPAIQAAIDAAEEGAIIEVQAGTYKENLSISKGIHLQGASRENVIIEGLNDEKPTVTSSNGTSHVVLQSMTISRGLPTVSVENSHVSLIDVNLTDNTEAIYVANFGVKFDLFESSLTPRENGAIGILLLGEMDANIISNQITSYATGVLVSGRVDAVLRTNTISSTFDAVVVGSSARATIIENDLSHNVNAGIRISGNSEVDISNNVIWSNSFGVVLALDHCRTIEPENEIFTGIIKGTSNEMTDNLPSNLCPSTYDWPEGFLL